MLGDMKPSFSSTKGRSSGASYARSGDMRSSTNHEALHVPREQTTWQQGQIGYARGISSQAIISICTSGFVSVLS